MHLLKTAYEDRGTEFDPVLLAIPRSRRRREGAMAVYSVRDGRIEREIFRVLPDTYEIVMRSTDERALEAAIVKAHHDFGPPLRFQVDESRVRQTVRRTRRTIRLPRRGRVGRSHPSGTGPSADRPDVGAPPRERRGLAGPAFSRGRAWKP